jgi:hypothetical protein
MINGSECGSGIGASGVVVVERILVRRFCMYVSIR